ncbi:MAG: sigma-70 family RNA polymerase sigma factor [Crocinitomicaceae bacterium]|tara:strand:- start:2542 stop:3126 length:585 start_codon:yes stop_codon:yes gene_type:complete
MSNRQHYTVFNELLNRYDSLFISVIRRHFPKGNDAEDIYQDFLIHLFILIETHYESALDLLHTSSWLKAVVSNFCKSVLRKKNAKKTIKFTKDGFLAEYLDQYSDVDESNGFIFDLSENPDAYTVMTNMLSLLSKQDALVLKMKYYYGKSSLDISRKLNISHVDVKIARLKSKIIKLTGVKNLEHHMGYFENRP